MNLLQYANELSVVYEASLVFSMRGSVFLVGKICSIREVGNHQRNKAGYTATPVACGWAGAVLEKVTRAFG